MQRNVRSGFRLHPRFADPEASVVMEFMIKSARKLVVAPPMTVGLSSCSAAIRDVSLATFSSVTDAGTVLVSFFFLGEGSTAGCCG